MRGLEEQYVPGKHFRENLGRPTKSVRKSMGSDDSLAAIAGISTMRKNHDYSKSKTEDLFSYSTSKLKTDNVQYTPNVENESDGTP